MKIDYTKDFTKFAGSKEQAIKIAKKVAELNNEKLDSWTVIKVGRYIKGAEGRLNSFKWYYSALDREIWVSYIDGRPQTEIKPKKTYYIIHIEGFKYKTGDKVKSFNKDGSIVYTHKMTDAMRIQKENINVMKNRLRKIGIADWVVDNPNTFVEIHYAPKGTLFA